MKAIIMLEDGKAFFGESHHSGHEAIGEVIFNTAVVGYQEMLTDPANFGKLLVLTYPLIGNYGVAPAFNESSAVWASGLILKEESRIFSNWQARKSLTDFLREHSVTCITGVDTRSLVVHLRQKGALCGIISTGTFEKKELLSRIAQYRNKPPQSALPRVSVARKRLAVKSKKRGRRIALLDLGVTNSLLRQLESLGCSVTIYPYTASAQEIMRTRPDAVVISSGPEEDPGLEGVAARIRPLLGNVPLLGISTGLQVIAMALGAKIIKMKAAHRGGNYPVLNPKSYRGEITVQNHGWTVDASSLGKVKGVKVTASNLNDRTIEEFENTRLKLMAVQYTPVSPGLGEAHAALKRFFKTFAKE